MAVNALRARICAWQVYSFLEFCETASVTKMDAIDIDPFLGKMSSLVTRTAPPTRAGWNAASWRRIITLPTMIGAVRDRAVAAANLTGYSIEAFVAEGCQDNMCSSGLAPWH